MSSIWVGLFEVAGPPENSMLDGNVGACLWMAAQAQSAEHMELRVKDAMQKLGLTVVDSEQVSEVVNEDDLSAAVWELLPEAKQNEASVVCGTWHLFKNFDA